jgi:hypothetical protein
VPCDIVSASIAACREPLEREVETLSQQLRELRERDAEQSRFIDRLLSVAARTAGPEAFPSARAIGGVASVPSSPGTTPGSLGSETASPSRRSVVQELEFKAVNAQVSALSQQVSHGRCGVRAA